MLGLVQALGLLGRGLALFFDGGLDGGHGFFGQGAHELAHELHLPPPALEVGDFFAVLDGVEQLFRQVQPLDQVGP